MVTITSPSCIWSTVSEITLSGEIPGASDLGRFLEALKKHITIQDALDESHSLSLHRLPPPSGRTAWRRTRLGALLYRAKDYDRKRPVRSTGAANTLAGELESFILRHPRYRAAEVIITAPSSDPTRGADLPACLGDRLAASLGKRIAGAERVAATMPQKDREALDSEATALNQQRNSIVVKSQLRGSSWILLDDLYESGGTLVELARACREAAASEVLGLTVTKTAKYTKYTRGMDTEKWPWG